MIFWKPAAKLTGIVYFSPRMSITRFLFDSDTLKFPTDSIVVIGLLKLAVFTDMFSSNLVEK